MMTIMRLRLKRILDYLETSPGASGGLLASLDADTCQWIRSARSVEVQHTGGRGEEAESGNVAKEPLRSTHGVLLCLARALPRDSRYKVRHGVTPSDSERALGCLEDGSGEGVLHHLGLWQRLD